METPTNCRWCRTRMGPNPAGILACPHCDENAHDPTGCTLCRLGAEEVERVIRAIWRR
jgi:hypothetical protein